MSYHFLSTLFLTNIPPIGGFIFLCYLFVFIVSFNFDFIFQQFVNDPEVIAIYGITPTMKNFIDDIYSCIELHMEMGTTPSPQESYLWDYFQSHENELAS